ncbi:unnamed protein product [Mytilus coruscus]|uniref:Uncharacterized protein n=1 Tax=Mytilus coruscus TaxID=42192 RepID=A0A6J8E715_MYTCO|nr:unnamed protein product [Mytilus coruscus]
MDDRELSKFIPRYGDRVLVRRFLRKQNSPNTRNPKRKSKGGIVSSLKQTLKAERNKNRKKVVQTQNRKIQVKDTLVTKMLLKDEVVDDTLSVGDLYTATGLTLLTFYILLTPVEEESIPKLSLPKKSVKIDEQHEKEQTDEKEQDVNDLTHSVGTDIIAEAMLSSGVADFDAFLEPENIDVPGDFNLPVEEPVTLNEALTQNQDGPMVLDEFRVSHPSPMMTETQKIRVHRSDLLNDIIQRNLMFEYVNEKGSDLDGVFLRNRRLQGTCLELEVAGRRMDVHRAYHGKGLPGPPNSPLQLSKVTTIVIAFGEETVTSADLFSSFLHFVSQTDSDLIQAALKDDLKGEDKDELLDLLERFQWIT